MILELQLVNKNELAKLFAAIACEKVSGLRHTGIMNAIMDIFGCTHEEAQEFYSYGLYYMTYNKEPKDKVLLITVPEEPAKKKSKTVKQK